MKRIIMFSILFFWLFSYSVNAQTFEYELSDETDLYSQIYSDFNTQDLIDNTPDEANEFLEKFSVSIENPFSFSDLFSADGAQKFIEYIKGRITSPLISFTVLIILIVVCALANSLTNNTLETNYSLNMICGMVCITAILLPVSSLISGCVKLIGSISVFMGVFIPIFAGVLIACIKSATAISYSSLMFFTCQAVSAFCTSIVLPFSNCFLALSVTSSLCENNKIGGIVNTLKKCAYIVLTTAMALFLAVLSIQGAVNNVADNAATKTTKFFISSFVPIIGPSISEALGSFRGCISLLKSSIGIYVIIVIAVMVLPVIFQILLYKLFLVLSGDVAQMFSVSTVKRICESVNSTLSIILAVVLCSGLMFVFSIAIISVLGGMNT